MGPREEGRKEGEELQKILPQGDRSSLSHRKFGEAAVGSKGQGLPGSSCRRTVRTPPGLLETQNLKTRPLLK